MSATTPELLDRAVIKLDPASARIKRFSALTTMTLPVIGVGIGMWMAVRGHLTVLDVVLFFVMYFAHMTGITIGFHRYAAHRAFRTSRPLEAVLMIAGSIGAQGPLMFWVSTHRRHHRFSDQHGDPHSPNLHGAGVRARLHGLWYAHMPWMLSDESSRWSVFGPDVLRDRRLMWYQRTYPIWVLVGLLLPAAVALAVRQTAQAALGALVYGGLVRIFVANQAAWCVGSLCHSFGSRPFDNEDRSANNWPVALLTFGEGLQNNHHAFPGSFRHAVRWWEPDLSGSIIAGLDRLGLVWDARRPEAATVERRRARARRAGAASTIKAPQPTTPTGG
jgi:stearoyl-CoA desaturase (delta-9 desaturase)